MRLQRLRLQNFRQHVDTIIDFRPGLTGIIGPNGAGKTTILEGIAWAVYGASAARGTNDTIRFARAAPRAKVIVDLSFELESHEYRVTRTLNSAEVYLDNGLNPVATGVSGATAYLQSKLGMTLDEFFNTYFTGQKELQFLAQLGPADRARFFAQVLGYERLRRAQDIAKNRRRELGAEIDGLKAGLTDPAVLKVEREAVERQLGEARKNAARILKTLAKLEQDKAAATPVWKSAQDARAQAQRLTFEIDAVTRELNSAQREVERAAGELQKVSAAQANLAAIMPQLGELVVVTAATEQQEELSRAHERMSVLQQSGKRLLADSARLDTALEGLKQAPALLAKAQAELAELKSTLPGAVQLRETLLAQYQKDVQDNRTELRILEAQQQELETQIRKLNDAGESGDCPICTKPLGHEYGTVLEHLQLELEDRRNIIKWRTSREKQLAKRPAELVEAERTLAQLQTAIEKKTEREAKCQKGAEELWRATEEKQLRDKQLAELRAEWSAVPAGYDREAHTQLRNRLAELQQFARQASVYEHEIATQGVREAELAAAQERRRTLGEKQTQLHAELKHLGFAEQTYEKLKAAYEKLTAEAHAAQIAGAQANQALAGAEAALRGVERAEAAYQEKREKLGTLESELRHHSEMDVALTRLRTELNARVRPELAELASSFLSEITDGRYSGLEIDEGYNVLVLEDGEEKPVISGGEEDVANLVLRIAISQMIAERAGQQLSTLFLDEVFGSLDLERRDNVIQLLQRLHERFEQVILITHVETVREGLHHVIRLSYDERSGASVVKEETSSLTAGLPQIA
ncbi:MAG: AAA family ATPase [Gemmatimonadota bacterium]